MAFYLAQASGLLNSAFPWSMNFVLSSNNTESAVAATFNTAIRGVFTNAALDIYIPPTVSVTETSVSTASSQFKQTTKTINTAVTPGVSASISLPYQMCEILTFRTPFATKWGRGRCYFPPLAVNALAAGGFTILPAAQAALQTAWNAYFTAVGANYTHQILHRKAPIGGVRTPFTTDQVATADIPSTFSVQTRRADKLVPSRLSVTV
jgi:hypothetical protein